MNCGVVSVSDVLSKVTRLSLGYKRKAPKLFSSTCHEGHSIRTEEGT